MEGAGAVDLHRLRAEGRGEELLPLGTEVLLGGVEIKGCIGEDDAGWRLGLGSAVGWERVVVRLRWS